MMMQKQRQQKQQLLRSVYLVPFAVVLVSLLFSTIPTICFSFQLTPPLVRRQQQKRTQQQYSQQQQHQNSKTTRRKLSSLVEVQPLVFTSVGSGVVINAILDRWNRQIVRVALATVSTLFLTTMMASTSLPAFAIETSTEAAATQQQSVVAVNKQQQLSASSSSSVVDEVWNLLNKYYIDRTFNNQNWETVRTKSLAKVDDNNNNNMKIIYNMVGSLHDKYTRVLDVEQYTAIQKYDLIGVGVTLMPNSYKDIIVGAPPIAKSPGDQAGLQVGDYVTAVNGIATNGRTAFDIIDQVAENANSRTITFSIARQVSSSSSESSLSDTLENIIVGDPNSVRTFDVTMDRQTMEVKDPVEYKISETRSDGTIVGYVRISEFNTLVNSSLEKAIVDLKSQGANAYVLDLRGNTGGAFQSAVEISGLFLRDRIATYVIDSNLVELPFRTPNKVGQDLIVEPDVPIVLFLDGMSASASEVLAGSLHDNCRAVTMGDPSYGKGLIQAVYGLKNGAGLVVTVAQYITPNGTEIQGKGLIPDVAPGKNMPAPVFVPIFSTDTSKVDFDDVRTRLDTKHCRIPDDRIIPTTTITAESAIN